MSTEVSAPDKNAIKDLADALRQLPTQTTELPLLHYFAKGLYGRRIFMPAGSIVVSRVHKQQHLTIVLYGRSVVADAFGDKLFVEGPDVFVTEPGMQRALIMDTDSEWITVHQVADTEGLKGEDMAELLTFKTFAEYESYLAAIAAPEE